MQFLLQKFEQQLDLVQLQKGIVQKILIMDGISQKQINPSEEPIYSKDLDPAEYSHEIIYF